MAEVISVSMSREVLDYIKNKGISKSKLFQRAVMLHKHIEALGFDGHDLLILVEAIERQRETIGFLNKEIERRNERLESLQDVLAKQELRK